VSKPEDALTALPSAVATPAPNVEIPVPPLATGSTPVTLEVKSIVLAAIFALVTARLSIVHVAPLPLTVMSP
jgi:hypothetical protein